MTAVAAFDHLVHGGIVWNYHHAAGLHRQGRHEGL